MRKLSLILFLVLAAAGLRAQTLLSESFNVSSATSSLPTGWTVSSTGTTTGCNGLDWMQVPSGGFVCSVNGTPSPRPSGQSGSGMAGYNSWDIDLGGVSVMATPSLNFSALGTYTVSFWVFQQNTLISNAHDTLKVYVNTSPTTTGGTLLYASDPNYNSSPAGWAQYTYNIPTTYTGTTNYIVFLAKSNWGQDIFIDDVEVVRLPPTACSGTPLTPLITNSAINPPLCVNSTVTLNATDPNLPTTSGIAYQWETGSSSTGPWSAVTGGSGATTLSYTTGSLSAGAWYRIGAICTNSSLTAWSAAFQVPVGAPQPGIISGPTTFCPGDTATYSVSNVSGSTYTWTLPAGWSGSSTTNSILVTPGTAAGNIDVTATTSCGTSAPRTQAISAGSAPAQVGTIAGNDNICFGSTQTYSVNPVSGATSYTWYLPSGWSGSSTTNSITVTANTNPGNVGVRAVNGCGTSPLVTLPVSIITALPDPGVITGKDTVCEGGLLTYSVAPVPGATSYVWVLPTGWSGTTTGNSIQAYAGTTSGTLQVTAYVACATSPASDTFVVVNPSVNPAVTISAPSGLLCQGRPLSITANASHPGTAAVYQWTINSLPVPSFGNVYVSSSFVPGDTISVVMTSNASCAINPVAASNHLIPIITPSVTPGISINTVPPVTLCKGTPLTFSTVVAGAGNTPGYQWFKNGTAISGGNGATYTDPALRHADTITVEMTTSAVCPTAPVAYSNKVGVRVDDPLTPSVSIAVYPSDVVTPGMPLTFTATESNGGATPDFQWFRNGVIIPFETGATYSSSSLKAGDHIAVRMLSYATCVDPGLVFSNTIALKAPLGVGGTGSGSASIRLFPNPNNGRFNLAASGWDGAGRQLRIEVLNLFGQCVYRRELTPAVTNAGSWETPLELQAGIAAGSYILRVSAADGSSPVAIPFVITR